MNTNAPCAWVDHDSDLIERLQAGDRVVVLFYASWCPFCARFLPIFQRHAGMVEGMHFVLAQDDAEMLAPRYDVKVYPTVLLFEKGALSERLDGAAGVGLNEEKLLAFLSREPSVR